MTAASVYMPTDRQAAYTFGKLTVGIGRVGGGEILASTRLARSSEMDPKEPASRHEEANESGAYEDSHQSEMVSCQ